jgi:hypothetical protein
LRESGLPAQSDKSSTPIAERTGQRQLRRDMILGQFKEKLVRLSQQRREGKLRWRPLQMSPKNPP